MNIITKKSTTPVLLVLKSAIMVFIVICVTNILFLVYLNLNHAEQISIRKSVVNTKEGIIISEYSINPFVCFPIWKKSGSFTMNHRSSWEKDLKNNIYIAKLKSKKRISYFLFFYHSENLIDSDCYRSVGIANINLLSSSSNYKFSQIQKEAIALNSITAFKKALQLNSSTPEYINVQIAKAYLYSGYKDKCVNLLRELNKSDNEKQKNLIANLMIYEKLN